MGIGVSVFLMAVGAILAFAVDEEQLVGIDINVVGFILIAAGVVGLLLTVLLRGPRRRTSVEQRRVYDEAPDGSIVEERRRYESGGPGAPLP